MTSPIEPIFEPELNFLEHGCECGARFAERGDLELHRRETCGRRKGDAHYREPLFIFDEDAGPSGVAYGGRRM